MPPELPVDGSRGGYATGGPVTGRPAPVPSVGRIVHYRSYGTPNGEYVAECRAAIITEVGAWLDTAVGPVWTDGGQDHRTVEQTFDPTACRVTVENPAGTFKNVVRFDVPPTAEDGTTTPTPGTWHWPEQV